MDEKSVTKDTVISRNDTPTKVSVDTTSSSPVNTSDSNKVSSSMSSSINSKTKQQSLTKQKVIDVTAVENHNDETVLAANDDVVDITAVAKGNDAAISDPKSSPNSEDYSTGTEQSTQPFVITRRGDGSCVSTRCNHCSLLPTNHYCVTEKKGSNVFFSDNRGKEVCGRATCFECRQKFGDIDGEYANICLDCVSEKILEKNNSTAKKTPRANKKNETKSTSKKVTGNKRKAATTRKSTRVVSGRSKRTSRKK